MRVAILVTFALLACTSFVEASPFEKRQSCVGQNGQCGGKTYKGATCCVTGFTCIVVSDWYSQCRSAVASPSPSPSPPPKTSPKTSPVKTTTTTSRIPSPSPVDPAKDFRKPFPGTNPSYYWRNEGECTKPFIRKEWRKLTKTEQKSYLDAVNCANNKKAISTAAAPGAKTRFDDFCGSHIRQSDNIHGVGHFLPWHRMYVAFFEEYLAAECGYTGGVPYWDWSLDSDATKFTQSPIFASDAFGGNGPKVEGSAASVGGLEIPGRTGGGCVQDGAFKNMTISLGPGNSLTANPRCLSRDLVPSLATNFEKSKVDKILAATTYVAFDAAIEPAPAFGANGIDWQNVGVHGAGHYSIGGSLGAMGNAHSSCGDPTFFLHHGNMDRLWWVWQLKDSKRLTEMGGRTMQGQTVTLDFKMDLNELTAPWPNLTVRQMMNIKGGPLCYDYE